MAVVLNTQITLDPGNQIAHLADFTGLEVGTEYVVAGSFLQSDTRFTFLGYFDITLTRPPLSVPAAQTEVPATVSTVPMPAAATPPATYPYTTNDRMVAANLNNAFEFNAAATPPNGNAGGAGQFNQWIDTSGSPVVTLRQCVVPQATAGLYVPAEWVDLSYLNLTTKRTEFNGAVVGFGNGLVVNGNTNINGTLGVSGGATIGGSSTINNLNVTGTLTAAGAALPYVKLAGDSMTGGLFAPTVTVNNMLSFQDRTIGASQYWGWYAQDGLARLWMNQRGDLFYVNWNTGVTTFNGNVAVVELLVGGLRVYNDAGWFHIVNNVQVPYIQSSGGVVGVSLRADGGGNAIYAPNGNIFTPNQVIGNAGFYGVNWALTGNSDVGSAVELWRPSGGNIVKVNLRVNEVEVLGNLTVGFSGGTLSVGGQYWYNNGSWMYTPSPLWTGGNLKSNGPIAGNNAVAGAAARLYTWNSTNWMFFRWDGSDLWYNIDGAVEKRIATSAGLMTLDEKIQQLTARIEQLEGKVGA